jgi:hypothetical protein
MTSSCDDHERPTARSMMVARRRLEQLMRASVAFGAIASLGMTMLMASFTRGW